MIGEPAIVATDLTKQFGDTVALDGVSLSVPAGTVYGFLGPNGAGKTTTIRLLTGLAEPTAGTVRVGGVSVDDRRTISSFVGYQPETPPLYETFSAWEQLEYVADLRDISRQTAQKRITDYLERFGMVDDADSRISSYSKGTKQKVSFIQSVLHDPDVLFLDEPTAGLDPRAARRIRECIAEFAADGTTVFLSTHILPVVEAVADRIGVLFDGSIVAAGTPRELRARATADGDGDSSLEDAFIAITDSGAHERSGPV